MNAETLEILRKVKRGEISASEAAERLIDVESQAENFQAEATLPDSIALAVEQNAPVPGESSFSRTSPQEWVQSAEREQPASNSHVMVKDIQPELGWWGNAWLIIFWAGTVIFVAGAIAMGWAYTARSSFWIACSWLPMLFGMLALFLGWWSRQAHWVHVRIQEPGERHISISVPLPLRLAAWGLRAARPFVPKLREQQLEILPMIFDAIGHLDDPIFVEVNEKDGEKVLVYIR